MKIETKLVRTRLGLLHLAETLGNVSEACKVMGYSRDTTAGAIASNFDTARPTVSKHLQILTACELLKQEQSGREIYYHINAKKMKVIADFIEPFRNMWEDRFTKLEAAMKKHNTKK